MHTPTLFLMVGYPGSGKTTASRHIAELTGAVHLWADHERSKRFDPVTHSHAENLELYAQLNRETRELLHQGKSVVFDTNFNFYKDRKKLRVLAAREGARAFVIWIVTPKDLARERATQHESDTRIWGGMPLERFERIAHNLQEPDPAEKPIRLDGTRISREDIEQMLKNIGLI